MIGERLMRGRPFTRKRRWTGRYGEKVKGFEILNPYMLVRWFSWIVLGCHRGEYRECPRTPSCIF